VSVPLLNYIKFNLIWLYGKYSRHPNAFDHGLRIIISWDGWKQRMLFLLLHVELICHLAVGHFHRLWVHQIQLLIDLCRKARMFITTRCTSVAHCRWCSTCHKPMATRLQKPQTGRSGLTGRARRTGVWGWSSRRWCAQPTASDNVV